VINRRDFITQSAVAMSSLTLSFRIVAGEVVAVKQNDATPWLGDFIRITPDNRVLFQFIKQELGQGLVTSMTQILCEELDADWDQIDFVFSKVDLARYANDANGGYWVGGSCALVYTYPILRKAGATARQMLIAAAAQNWSVSAASCHVTRGWVIHANSGRRTSFGELAAAAAQLPIPQHVELKKRQAFQVIGTPRSNKMAAQIVRGALTYGMDVKIPEMSYAVIARAPVFKGKLVSYDTAAAMQVKGVKKVFTTQAIAGAPYTPSLPHDIREGVVVVADSTWAAIKGREALKIQWDDGHIGKLSSADFEQLAADRALQRGAPVGFFGDPDAIADMQHVRKTLHAAYIYPHQLHSCMETLNCTIHVRENACEVWLGTQVAELCVEQIAELLKIPQENVTLHMRPAGGGFGRRAYTDIAVEAAFVSREAGNIPVKLLWTREDDQQCNFVHLFQHMEFQAALDEHRRLFAWYEKELRTYTWGERYANPELPAMAYQIPNVRYDFENLEGQQLVQSSAWRGVVMHGRALRECFIDEIAAELKMDPYEFRLSLLKPHKEIYYGGDVPLSSDRMIKVLQLAAKQAGYQHVVSEGRGMGIALILYGNACCAAVADVAVEDAKLKVHKITVAVDCGQVVNPSGANQQIVGGIIWGLTALLHGGAPIENGRLVRSNFHENPLLRMNECPEIDVHFVESRDETPWGLGEASAPLAVPAVLNAIFAATGKRIRRIPLTSDLLS
jgi:isoquinoline 1-oxidoreductase beta subunit